MWSLTILTGIVSFLISSLQVMCLLATHHSAVFLQSQSLPLETMLLLEGKSMPTYQNHTFPASLDRTTKQSSVEKRSWYYCLSLHLPLFFNPYEFFLAFSSFLLENGILRGAVKGQKILWPLEWASACMGLSGPCKSLIEDTVLEPDWLCVKTRTTHGLTHMPTFLSLTVERGLSYQYITLVKFSTPSLEDRSTDLDKTKSQEATYNIPYGIYISTTKASRLYLLTRFGPWKGQSLVRGRGMMGALMVGGPWGVWSKTLMMTDSRKRSLIMWTS